MCDAARGHGQDLAVVGPERATHYPKTTLPGAEKEMTLAEAQSILGISGEESLTGEQEQERQLGAVMMTHGFELLALNQVSVSSCFSIICVKASVSPRTSSCSTAAWRSSLALCASTATPS